MNAVMQKILFGSRKERKRKLEHIPFGIDIAFLVLLFVEFFSGGSKFLLGAELIFGLYFLFQYCYKISLSKHKIRFIFEPLHLLDLLILLVIFYRFFVDPTPFLQMLASLRILRSYRLFFDIPQRGFVARHHDTIFALLNLMVFVFLMTSVVFALQQPINPQIQTTLDALYFTLSTLTTTGFGDIVVVGQSGRFLASLIMIFGVVLFLRLAASIFRPRKIFFECSECGLTHHEADAAHCKHCGHVVHIKNDGRQGGLI